MAVEQIAAVQALVVGVLFAWAGTWKVLAPGAGTAAVNSALDQILPQREWTPVVHRLIGAGELVVAALLLLSPWHWFGIRIATVFSIGFLVYLVLARRIAPNQSCGCMGSSAAKISPSSVWRAAWLLALTVIGWRAHDFWANALIAAPWLMLPVAIEVIVVWQLSPELGPVLSLRPLFIRAMRFRLDPDCRSVAVDWERVEARLRNTATFQELNPLLGARTDRWREGCWGFVTYGATYNTRDATAVFAFPVRFDTLDVSAAVVDDTTNTTVFARPTVNDARPSDTVLVTEAVGDSSPSAA